MDKPGAQSLWIDNRSKIIAFERGGLLFAFNFHPTRSATKFFLHTHPTGSGDYKAIFSTDDAEFGGQGRIDEKYVYSTTNDKKRGQGFEIYLPCRTAVVFKKVRGGRKIIVK